MADLSVTTELLNAERARLRDELGHHQRRLSEAQEQVDGLSRRLVEVERELIRERRDFLESAGELVEKPVTPDGLSPGTMHISRFAGMRGVA